MDTINSSEKKPLSAWEAAEAEGIDMSLLEESLRMTPEERIRENCRMLATIKALQEAWQKQHGDL